MGSKNLSKFSVDMEKAWCLQNWAQTLQISLSLSEAAETSFCKNVAQKTGVNFHLSLSDAGENQRLQKGVWRKPLGLTLGREKQPAHVRKN